MSDFFSSSLEAIASYLPTVGMALLILLAGWVVALLVGTLVRRLVARTGMDRGIEDPTSPDAPQPVQLSKAIGSASFWVVMLFVLLAVCRALGLTIITDPLDELLAQFGDYLPRILAAVLLFFVAWIVASVLRVVVTQAMIALRVDQRLKTRSEHSGFSMARTAGDVVFYFALVLFLPGILGALAMGGLLQPVQQMVADILASLPGLFAAGIIIGISFLIGRIVGSLLSNLLASVGFNNVLGKLGFRVDADTARSPAEVVGFLVFAAIMLFAASEAAQVAGFATVAGIITELTYLLGRIVLGLIIFGFGLFFANLAGNAISASGSKHAGRYAVLARTAILALVGAMALGQMGFADSIITLAFGLTLGAVAVAVAVAFGMGGRDEAKDVIQNWRGTASDE